ncbi:MAG: hypothetical protein LBC64_07485 [Fibromonadaceae bacterium]|jgi:hypothetical protein|nr:hypothetical protein [Fibromonadaceae bacterium]
MTKTEQMQIYRKKISVTLGKRIFSIKGTELAMINKILSFTSAEQMQNILKDTNPIMLEGVLNIIASEDDSGNLEKERKQKQKVAVFLNDKSFYIKGEGLTKINKILSLEKNSIKIEKALLGNNPIILRGTLKMVFYPNSKEMASNQTIKIPKNEWVKQCYANKKEAEKFWALIPKEIRDRSTLKKFEASFTSLKVYSQMIDELWLFYAIVKKITDETPNKNFYLAHDFLKNKPWEGLSVNEIQSLNRQKTDYEKIVQKRLGEYYQKRQQINNGNDNGLSDGFFPNL